MECQPRVFCMAQGKPVWPTPSCDRQSPTRDEMKVLGGKDGWGNILRYLLGDASLTPMFWGLFICYKPTSRDILNGFFTTFIQSCKGDGSKDFLHLKDWALQWSIGNDDGHASVHSNHPVDSSVVNSPMVSFHPRKQIGLWPWTWLINWDDPNHWTKSWGDPPVTSARGEVFLAVTLSSLNHVVDVFPSQIWSFRIIGICFCLCLVSEKQISMVESKKVPEQKHFESSVWFGFGLVFFHQFSQVWYQTHDLEVGQVWDGRRKKHDSRMARMMQGVFPC